MSNEKIDRGKCTEYVQLRVTAERKRMVENVAKARGITQKQVFLDALRKQYRGQVQLGAEEVIETALEIVPEMSRQFDEVSDATEDALAKARVEILGSMIKRMVYILRNRIAKEPPTSR